MTQIMLTGIGGFVGSHTLAHIMHNTDWDVLGIDSFANRGKSERVTHMFEAHPEWEHRTRIITHDIAAPFTDMTVKEMGEVEYIISMASESHVDRSIEDPVRFIKNNVHLSLTMLELARKLQPKMFINIGTDEVYGPAPLGYNHHEWEPTLPSNPYAASKAAQEANTIAYWRTYNVASVLTNSMNMIGELQDKEKLIPSIIRSVLRGDEQIIYGTEGHIGSRFYIHCRNHADALLFILRETQATMYEYAEDSVSMPDRYNIVGEREYNNLEVAQIVADVIGKPLRYKLVDFHASRPGHDRRYALDGSKLANLGWKPPMTIQDTIETTVEWYLENQKWLE